MKRFILICSIPVIAFFLAPIAAGQSTSVSGQVIGPAGAPWADLDVSIQNTNTGEHFTVKTDKDGRYAQWGLRPGTYKITLHDPENKSFTYSETRMLRGTQENDVSINFSKKVKTSSPEEQNKAEEDANRFQTVKTHFNAGVGAMYDAQSLRMQLSTAPADQKEGIQAKLDSNYQTAIAEFHMAEQANSPIDTKAQAMILGHLGEAYDYAGQYDQAADAYQKAVALRPDVILYYQNLSKAQASSALAQTDPTAMQQKLAAAYANCDKAATFEPPAGATCWKNIGILLSNKGDLKQAVLPLQKATQFNADDAQAWFLFGRALLAMFETKQADNRKTAVFSPGTEKAFQKCIAIDPNGPYASQARQLLDGLVSLRAGEKTKNEDDKEKK